MNIELLIEKALEEDEKKEEDPKKLKITTGAFEKIKTYAKLLSKKVGSDSFDKKEA